MTERAAREQCFATLHLKALLPATLHPTPLMGVVVLQLQCNTRNTLQRYTFAGVAEEGCDLPARPAPATCSPVAVAPTVPIVGNVRAREALRLTDLPSSSVRFIDLTEGPETPRAPSYWTQHRI
jgi:hypothetical protein